MLPQPFGKAPFVVLLISDAYLPLLDMPCVTAGAGQVLCFCDSKRCQLWCWL